MLAFLDPKFISVSWWLWLIGGVIVSFLGSRRAYFTGRAFFAWHAGFLLDAPLAFGSRMKRWLLFYAPIVACTIAVSIMMPHWILAVVGVFSILWSFKSGLHREFIYQVQLQMGDFLKEGMEPTEALLSAERIVRFAMEHGSRG